jgi:hypothetical protein
MHAHTIWALVIGYAAGMIVGALLALDGYFTRSMPHDNNFD